LIIELDKRFQRRVKGMFGKYEFEVGVLEDAPHKKAKIGERGKKGVDALTGYAGGPARKKTMTDSGMTIAQISAENRKRLGFNYLIKPFEDKNSDVIKFTNEFFKLVFGRSEKKRAENLLQAVVRNPILRGDYGPNAPLTILIKGFDRAMIDTAQLFKAIRAKCKVKGGPRV
jgi:hypothetical protein